MKDNPNVIEVELTLSQLEYMEGWGNRMNGMAPDTLIRMMIDTMMKTQPQLAEESHPEEDPVFGVFRKQQTQKP